jgi:mannose-6-phosphate isomerase-like protein (cupin superfamily)
VTTPYTRINLNQVADAAPKFGLGETQEARFATTDLEAETTGVAYHVIRPGQRSGVAHRHEKAEEVYVVLGGSGRAKLDDAIIDIGALDAIRVAPRVTRSFEAGTDGLTILAFGPHHTGDGEIIQNWWVD